MIISLCGKVAFAAGFQLITVMTAEFYPTYLRSIAVGEAIFFAKFGGFFSPYINDFLVNNLNKK